jgi:thiol-disulfide isomerase/thioredoxin
MIKRIAVVVGAVAIVAVLAVVAFRPSSPNGTASATAFDLPSLIGGGRVRLAAFRGEPVVVTMYASWCTACTTELPGFARAAARLRGRVQFIAVDSQETGDGAAFAARFGLAASGFTLARDIGQSSTGGLFKAYAARGLPVTVFYSRSGTIDWKALEAVPEAQLQQQLALRYGV